MGVSCAPVNTPSDRLKLRIELDALVAFAFDLTYEEFAHILLDETCGAVGFMKTDAELPPAYRQPQLTLDVYRQLQRKGLDRFLQDGAEVPEAVRSHRRPLVEIWSPADGWDRAWAEARTMADSDHEWDLFLGEEYAAQAEYGSVEEPLETAPAPGHGIPPYMAATQIGALFDTEEFRRDGQQRLL